MSNTSSSNQPANVPPPAEPAGAPATNPPAAKPSKSAAAITAMVLGIVAIVISPMPIINNFAFILGIIALIFAIVALVGTSKGRKSGKGFAITGLILSIVSLVIVLATQATYAAVLDEASNSLDRAAGNATEEVLGTDVDVQSGNFTLKKDGYGMITSELPITVKNLTDESASFTIQLEAVDENGDRIMQDTVYASSLGAGQSQTFKAFTWVTSDDYEAMKTAKFNILSVGAF